MLATIGRENVWWSTINCTYCLSCTRLRILLNTIYRKPGFNSLRTPLNHGAEQANNETLKQTQQRNWSNASQGGQTALKEHVAVLHSETASTMQQPRGEHRDTIKDCKIAGATTWQGQSNHTFTTPLPIGFKGIIQQSQYLGSLKIFPPTCSVVNLIDHVETTTSTSSGVYNSSGFEMINCQRL